MRVESSAEAEDILRTRFLRDLKHDFIVQTDRTQEREFGWVLFYTTRRFAETGDPSSLVPGVGPVVVMRDGKIVPLTTSAPPKLAIATFETEWRKSKDANGR
ncbi:YrhB domain-containing protein [Sinorhizobium fredii]|uniref:YrhB domain-containing protein n=1 Tax=Rhizobium fredii TaxID=380 RepID=UPI0005B4285B|nr:YrhB domain-containing protein [Sinorhizobium fredii]